ncbi:hypothetical protein FT643_08390 [Ketobacter sp. MCCC 1A13808]|uniref:MAPEG family protein n=1 Tax=Ketobacter sp. MCCC 1A13808 TaxID=2602738 RepID=UPI000F1F18FC|nr:MAPEG family protein [Ketobacter sp. MCCC 1A13808]MVF12163.1 hypothetical protein [Ketobacter sp. MCCC 1A13808]RLP53217.1 MAG: hypothetical protein D6160_17055 [Ketobacter sp.]
MASQLLLPMFAHMLWTAFLYVALTIMRAPGIWRVGARQDGTNPWAEFEPKVAANLSNQFEWPLFFYVICVLLMSSDFTYFSGYTGLAWVFVGGRVIHSYVQICTSNIRLRGLLFTINFTAVLAMWGILIWNYAVG